MTSRIPGIANEHDCCPVTLARSRSEMPKVAPGAIEEMARSTWVYRKLRDFRAGVEGGLSFMKRSFGFDRCTWKGQESFKSSVWASILSANLLIHGRHRMPTPSGPISWNGG